MLWYGLFIVLSILRLCGRVLRQITLSLINFIDFTDGEGYFKHEYIYASIFEVYNFKRMHDFFGL